AGLPYVGARRARGARRVRRTEPRRCGPPAGSSTTTPKRRNGRCGGSRSIRRTRRSTTFSSFAANSDHREIGHCWPSCSKCIVAAETAPRDCSSRNGQRTALVSKGTGLSGGIADECEHTAACVQKQTRRGVGGLPGRRALRRLYDVEDRRTTSADGRYLDFDNAGGPPGRRARARDKSVGERLEKLWRHRLLRLSRGIHLQQISARGNPAQDIQYQNRPIRL